MRISWLGHSCFLIETSQGTKIVTDPYESGGYDGAVGYDPVNLSADIVTVSHAHPDHNYVDSVTADKIIQTSQKVSIKDVEIEGIDTFHDDEQGKARGNNIIFIIRADDLTIAHFGDLGTKDIDVSRLNDLDVALIPVGGTFTLGALEAAKLIDKIKPKVVVPMHFKTAKLGFSIAGVEKFLTGRDHDTKDVLNITADNIGLFKNIVILKHQR
jgi:L-ascorbate metabolism protein UlaG (beta-lactamase superfamily)